VRRSRLQHLIMAGWKPMLVVNWYGHGQEFIPWPETDGYGQAGAGVGVRSPTLASKEQASPAPRGAEPLELF
jgi:hypothetical protein